MVKSEPTEGRIRKISLKRIMYPIEVYQTDKVSLIDAILNLDNLKPL